MNLNPWQAELLVPRRRDEFEQAAAHHRPPLPADEPMARPAPSPRSRPALARHVGFLLIAVGRRLTEPPSFRSAFDGPHRH